MRITNAAAKGFKETQVFNEKLAALSTPQPLTIDERAAIRHTARTPEQAETIQKAWDKSRKEAHRQAILDAAKVRQAARTPEQIKAIVLTWNTNRLRQTVNDKFSDLFENIPPNSKIKILPTNRKGINGSTDKRGNIYLTQERLDECSSAVGKIRTNKLSELTDSEGDALSTLWHEITHNRHIGLDYAGSLESKSRAYMELANEFTARKTLTEFYGRLGVRLDELPDYIRKFVDFRDSTSYNRMVTNYDYVIKRMNLNSSKVLSDVRNHLFNAEYNNQMTGLKNALINGGLRDVNGSTIKASVLNDLMRVISEAFDMEISGCT